MGETDFIFIIKMILIGIVQGFTEPIPVSSSGHVMIVSEILGLGEQGLTFAILTNTASLLAILYIYRQDIVRLTANSIRYLKTKNQSYKSDFRFVCFIIIGTIPAGVLGILLNDFIAENVSMATIAVMLFVTGIALWFIRNMKGTKGESNIKIKDAFIVGLGQAVALTPGISRSGATIISSIAVGMKQDTALRFSFMLYIPVSLGGVILGFSDFLNEPNKADLAIPYLAAFVATLLMTYFAMKWFMGIMKNGKLVYFTYYCFIVGALLLIFF
ncbi:undecaprenyl-diphosphate phosphatase [Bacillus sp. DTU_2020_1000418_1_SI_GHA_SEK_038]|uniref:undecaprenyl-diphosphate phosphatase n=1 Tax=Bacillus sp. DTU_2020_1000418_1_SI_GHA_SEK_038 TaxID=3077585 RepID=UPI0028EDFAA8|nr:undecaprenyl-diphosphate phosphatase [Bacillus sp. DTU_2020_1000418_1_SI_GHA_SEK_038]WNS76474.1 undecaprenyl-diphosphate phosphatase [Bacillus sp. DTU_2020_1000418_1_SI_GHA_SEK_038]